MESVSVMDGFVSYRAGSDITSQLVTQTQDDVRDHITLWWLPAGSVRDVNQLWTFFLLLQISFVLIPSEPHFPESIWLLIKPLQQCACACVCVCHCSSRWKQSTTTLSLISVQLIPQYHLNQAVLSLRWNQLSSFSQEGSLRGLVNVIQSKHNSDEAGLWLAGKNIVFWDNEMKTENVGGGENTVWMFCVRCFNPHMLFLQHKQTNQQTNKHTSH